MQEQLEKKEEELRTERNTVSGDDSSSNTLVVNCSTFRHFFYLVSRNIAFTDFHGESQELKA